MQHLPTPQTRQALVGAIPNLRAFALALCGDPVRADDLVQETLVKAWHKLDTFEEGTSLKSWLFTILRNTFYSEYRRRRRETSDPDGEHAAKLKSQPSQHSALELNELMKAMDLLPPDQREALLLVGAEGLAYEEVAAITGCAVGTVKSRVNRARAKIAKMLDGETNDLPGDRPRTSLTA
ncbi:MAG: sigma-70 family RNA polymerase sigma factor [Hyphomicrobiaceae bacterium]